jgi:hypothetical protein
MNDYKTTYSIEELAIKWGCKVETVIRHIEDGQLPLYCKSYVVHTISENAKATIAIPIRNKEKAAFLVKMVEEYNQAHPAENPLFENNCTLKIGSDCSIANDWLVNRELNKLIKKKEIIKTKFENGELTDDEFEDQFMSLLDEEKELEEMRQSDILNAGSIDQFSLCFLYSDDILNFEKQFHAESSPKTTNIQPPSIKRANSYNDCIAQVIADFTDINDYPPATVEEVINRMKNKPPLGTVVEFNNGYVSVDGSTPKEISKLSRAIKRLLEQKK